IRVAAGERLMNYIHVDDVCRSLVAGMRQLMRIAPPAYCVLDIRTRRQVGLPRLAQIVRRAARTQVPIVPFVLPRQAELKTRRLRRRGGAVGPGGRPRRAAPGAGSARSAGAAPRRTTR